jgi:pectin methylesterase-like acyl-CoA thioesterase
MKTCSGLIGPALAGFALCATTLAQAQDSRTVKEPVLPPACAVVLAEPALPAKDDAPRIQAAIDKCAPGHALHLAANNERRAFTSGPLVLRSGVTLVVDAGATLYASTDATAYDRGAKTCGSNDTLGKGCRPFITADDTTGSGIMGLGTIDGQGGHTIDTKTESWWQLARRAQKEKTRQNVPRLVEVNRSRDFTLYGVTLRNSPNFHVTLNRVDGFTAWGIRIDTPDDARNTDGIDPISSRNVTIAHSYIRTGDDNVAIKAGNSGPAENISILHNHFYSGHGMSIGSETNGGVQRVLVEDLSLDGTTSGLRIKSDISRGGPVSTVRYRDVCLRQVRTPIDIGSRYDPSASGELMPRYSDIVLENVRSVTPGKVVLQGYDEQNPVRVAMQRVRIAGRQDWKIQHASLERATENAKSDADSDAAVAAGCENRFPAFPQSPPRNVRPQLTTEQARAYEYQEVLKYTGTFGSERIDPWDPLADPLTRADGAAGFKPDYTVDLNAKADGGTVFNSVQAAISHAVTTAAAAAPAPGAARRIYILVQPGLYKELVYVPASNVAITLYSLAADPAATRISANIDAAVTGASYIRQFGPQFAAVHPSISEMYTSLKDRAILQTNGAAVVWVKNNGFQARNITFENSYNKDTGDARAECTPATCPDHPVNAQMNIVHHQAVALRVDGADKAQFENVRLIGFQDTLYLSSADGSATVRSFFNKSYIEGDVDFIFGDTIAYFNQCEVKSLGDRSTSYALAPDTSRRARYGFVFNACRFTNDGTPNASGGKFYLARQWFHNQRCTPYGAVPVAAYSCRLGEIDVFSSPQGTIRKRTLENVGKIVVMNSHFGGHINRANPWADWNKSGTLAYRPVQFSSADYRANLVAAGWDPARDLGDSDVPGRTTVDTYLAEYNNTNE